MKLFAVVFMGLVVCSLSSITASAQIVNTVYNDGANDGGSWSTDGNWSNTSPVTLSMDGDIVTVDIGTLPNDSGNVIILDLGGGTASIKSLTFDAGLTGTVTINPQIGDKLLIGNSGITNNALFAQDIFTEVDAGANSTFAGGTGTDIHGGTIELTFNHLNLETKTIATTGNVNILPETSTASLFTTIGSATIYGSTGAITQQGSFGSIGNIIAPGIKISASTLLANNMRTYVATLGDFFQIAQGNLAGSTIDVSDAFLNGTNQFSPTLTWVNTLSGKGIIFVGSLAGGTTINPGVTLPIGNDTEFNDGTGALGSGAITLAGGKLLTSYETTSDTVSTTVQVPGAGQGPITPTPGTNTGTAFSTSRNIILGSVSAAGNVAGTLAAVTTNAITSMPNTATYGGMISDAGTGTNGTLAIGDGNPAHMGTVILNGPSTYAGGTVINADTVITGNASALGSTATANSGQVALSATTTSVLNLNNTALTVGSLTSVISKPTITAAGTGYTQGAVVTITGGGGTGVSATVNVDPVTGAITGFNVLNFGTNYTSAPTSITVAGGTGASITPATYAASSITLGTGTLTIAGTNTTAANYTGVISGGGVVTKTGTGTQILSGVNTFNGGVNLNGGILQANSSTSGASLGASGNIDFGGGTLQLTGNDHADYSARIASGTSASAIALDVNGQAATFGTALTANQSGGLTLTATGGGSLTLNAASLYTGLTTVTSGTLKLGINNAIKTGNALTTGATGTLDLAGKTETLGTLTNADNVTSSSANGALTIGNNSSGAGTFTGNMSIIWNQAGSTSSLTGAFTNGGSLTLNATGAGNIGVSTANNTGNLVLDASSTGTITVGSADNAGTITNSATSSAAVTVTSAGSAVTGITQASNNGSTLTVTNLTVNTGTTTLTSTGSALLTVTNQVGNTSGSLVLDANSSGSITLAGGADNIGTITNSGSGTGTTTISGVIGTGVTGVTENTTGGSKLVLSAQNTYTAQTSVNSGTLVLGNATNTINMTNTLSTAGTGTLDLDGHAQTLGQLSNAGTVTSTVAGGALTFGDGSSSGGTLTGMMNVTWNEVGTNGSLTGSITNTGNLTLNATGAGNIGVSTANNTGNLVLDASSTGTITVASADNVGTITNTSTSASNAAVNVTTVGSAVTGVTQASNKSALAVTNLTVNTAGTTTLTSTGTAALTVASQVTGTGNLVLDANSTGNITLTNGANNTGTITNSGNGGVGSGTSTIGAIGAGVTGGVVQASANSELVLTGANSFTGGLAIQQGTVKVNTGTSVSTGAVTIGTGTTAGTLDLNGQTEVIDGLASGAAAGQTITNSMAGTTATVDYTGASSTFGGVIQNGSVNALTAVTVGSGSLTLSGNNTYTGLTSVNTGTLVLGAATNTIKTGNNLTTGASGVLDLHGNTQTLGTLNNAGNVTSSTGTGALTIGDGSTGAGTFMGGMNIIWNQVGSSTNLTGAITTTGNLNLNATGAGTIGVSTANNTGNVVLDASSTGTITVASADNAGTITNSNGSTAAVNVTSAGSAVTGITQNSGSSVLTVGSLAVHSSGTTLTSGGAAALTVTSQVTGTGNLVLDANSTGSITLTNGANNAGSVTNSGSSSGTSTIGTIGAGVTGGVTQNSANSELVLTGANSFTGGLAIQQGTVKVNNGTSVSTGTVTFGSVTNTNGTLDLNGQTEVIDGLATVGTGNQTITNNMASSTATVDYTGTSSTFGGVIKNGSGTALTAVTVGSGSLTLSGNNTYTGLTSVNTGTLVLGAAAANTIASGNNLTTGAGGVLDLDGHTQTLGTLNNGGNVTNSTGTGALTIGNGSTGAGTFMDSMNMVFNQGATTSQLTGAITTTGSLTLNATGAGNIGVSTANNTGNVVLDASSTGTITVVSADNAGTITNTSTSASNAAVNVTSVGSAVTGVTQASNKSALAVTNLTVNTAGTTTLTSTGTAALTVASQVTGTGALVLDANSTGNITLTNGANNAGSVTNSGGSSGTTTIGAIGAGVTGGVTQSSANSELVLTGANSFTGGLNIQQGTVKVSNGTAVSTGAVTFGSNTNTSGTLDLNGQTETIDGLATVGAGSQTITNSMAGTTATVNYTGTSSTFGGVIQNGSVTALTGVTVGSGALTLSGANTYTGATAINNGSSLIVSATGSTAAGSNVALNSGTLNVLGKVGGAITVGNGTGGIGILSGSGNGTTTGVTGAVTVNSGSRIDLTTDSMIGTLTVGNLTVNGGSALSFELGSSLGQNDKIAAGTLTINGATTVNIANLAGNNGQTLETGTYTLLSYTNGSVPANSNEFQLSSQSLDGDTLSLTSTATGLELTVSGSGSQSLTNPSLTSTPGQSSFSIISGATTGVTATLNNLNPTGSTSISVNLADHSTGGGTVSSLSAASGTTLGPTLSTTVTGTYTAGAAGTGTWGISNTDTLTTPNSTVTTGGAVTVYNTSAASLGTAGTLSITGGNNQTIITGGTLAAVTATLSNVGANTAPLQVGTVTNVTGGPTGSLAVASNSSGTYTVTGLSNTTVGTNSVTATVQAGDDSSIIGHGVQNTLSATASDTVLGHSNAALGAPTNNNQTIITGGTLAAVTVTLTNTGTNLSPLDVNTLSNLTGATGTAVVASGGTSTYTVTGLSNTLVGNNSVTASLKAGDEQSLSGANALATLSQTVDYTVLGHSNAALGAPTNNNQTIITGGTLATVQVTLSNTGTNLSPLDVNTLSNLTGATGTAVVASGGTSTYTVTGLSNTTVGSNSETVSLDAGDEQSLSGANALATLSQTVDYTVLGHSNAVLGGPTNNNQMIITGGTLAAVQVTLTNAGTNIAALDVNTLSNLTGTTGAAVVAANGSSTYTVTGLSNTTVGANSVTASLKAGDEQSLSGANALATLSQTVNYSVFGHASGSLSGSTLNLGDIHAGYTSAVTSSNSITASNAAGFLANLKGSATPSGGVSITSVSGIAAGATSGAITATLATGHGPGSFASQTYTFADDSVLSGASANVGTSTIAIAGLIYSGQSVWSTNGSGSWGTLGTTMGTETFGLNWGANQGSPGLDTTVDPTTHVEIFAGIDTATFGTVSGTPVATSTVSLNAAAPNLNSIIFNSTATSYTIAQGTGANSITLSQGTSAPLPTITDMAGTHTISAPIILGNTTTASATHVGDILTLSGQISGGVGLTIGGAGKVILSATTNAYSGPTTVGGPTAGNSGTLEVTNAGALGGGGALDLDNGSTFIGDGVTLPNTVAVNINGDVTLGNTGGAGGLNLGGAVTLTSATVTVDSATTISGMITGALTATGPATLTLTGNNSGNMAPTTVNMGTLLVINPAFLSNGLITLIGTAANAGILDVTGAGTIARDITVQPGSTGIIENNTGGGTLVLSQTLDKANSTLILAGTGTFNITGDIVSTGAAGFNSDMVFDGVTVLLNGTNSYAGSTFIDGGGTLQNGLGTAPAGTVLTLGNSTDGAVTNTFDLNGDPQSLGALESVSNAGSTNVNKVTDSGAAATLTLTGVNTAGGAASSNFGGVIDDGAGKIALVVMGGTHRLFGMDDYSGGTTLNGGKLVVGNAGALGTTSAVANTSLTQDGGTLVTDNTNHVINIAGGYLQNGGTLQIDINGEPTTADGTSASNDLVKVQGTAMLGGTVALDFFGSNVYHKGDSFKVVETNLGTANSGGLTMGPGFGATVINPPGFKISASVMLPSNLTDPTNNGNDLYVIITSTQLALTTIPGAVYTPNQLNIANYIDKNVLSGNLFALFSSAIAANPLSAPSLVAQFNPEASANFNRSSTFNNEVFQLQELDSYFESQRSAHGDFLAGSGQIDSSGLTVVDPSMDPALAQVGSQLLAWSPAPIGHGMLSDSADPVIAGVESKDMQTTTPTGPAFNSFVVGNVVLAQNFSQADLNHSNTTTGGVQLGADYRVTPHLRTGALFGYSHTDGTLDNNGSSATIDSYAPGAYVSFADKGWYANAVGSYGFDSFTEDRHVSIAGTTALAHGAPSGDHITGNLDGGYDFHVKNWTFGPMAGVEYTHLDVDAYSEDGAGAMNSDLAVNKQKADSLRSRVGGHVSYIYQTGKVLLTPHLDASWQHEFMDQSTGISANLVTFGGAPFTITTPRPSRDSALLDAGLNADVSGQVTVFGDYLIQAGQSNYFGQSVQAGVKIGF